MSAADRPPGVVLAGGRSLRMGSDKAAVMLGGRPLLQHVVARLSPQTVDTGVNSNAPLELRLDPGIAIFADTVSGHAGPMAGVLSAMRHARANFPAARYVVTVPTDTPFLPLDLVARLQSAVTLPGQIAVAWSAGIMHPVFALWPVDLADELDDWLRTDEKRRVRGFIERHPAVEASFPMIETPAGPLDAFFNINTPADLAIAERWLPLVEEIEK